MPKPKPALQLWYRPDRLDHATARQITRRVAQLAETMAVDIAQPVDEINGRPPKKLNLPQKHKASIPRPGEAGQP